MLQGASAQTDNRTVVHVARCCRVGWHRETKETGIEARPSRSGSGGIAAHPAPTLNRYVRTFEAAKLTNENPLQNHKTNETTALRVTLQINQIKWPA